MNPLVMSLGIGLMLIGVIVGLAGTVTAVVYRRDGLTVMDVVWAGSRAPAHPERYVRAERLVAVRRLNLAAVALFLSGVLLLAGRSLLDIW